MKVLENSETGIDTVIYENPAEYYEAIEAMEKQEPKDKRTMEYKAWKDATNRLMQECNDMMHWNAWKLIK